MSSERRIPIPTRHRIRRFQYSVMPGVIFVVCIAITCWLWDRQGRMPNAVGEVEAKTVTVAAGADGLLVNVGTLGEDLVWNRLVGWEVRAGDVVAEIDSELDWAAMDVLNADLERLRLTADAAVVTYNLDRARLKHEHDREARRIDWEIERRYIEVLQVTVLIEVDEKQLARLNKELEYLDELYRRNLHLIPKQQLEDVQLQKAVVERRLAENGIVREEANHQWEIAKDIRLAYPQLPVAEQDPLMAPYKEEVKVQLARVEELKTRMRTTLKVRAPIAGMVSEVLYRPGQYVRAGEPILTIAADKGKFVVVYIRQGQGFRPTEGMLVDLRGRGPGRPRQENLKVMIVGPQFEEVPPHLLRDPRIMEWGLPVCIAMPGDASPIRLKPGELVDIAFKPGMKETPKQ